MLADADILFGKLALGRRCLTREDAKRLVHELSSGAHMGRQESLPQAAVRLGYIAQSKAQELTQVIHTGSLICRGMCGRTFRLSGMTPDDTTACPDCRGHLYVARPDPASVATPAPVANEGGQGGVTVMELDFDPVDLGHGPPPVQTPPPDPIEDPPDPFDGQEDAAGKTFLDLDLDMPTSPSGADSGASPPLSTAPTSLDQLTPGRDSPTHATTVGSGQTFDVLEETGMEEEFAAPGGTMLMDDGFGDLVAEVRQAEVEQAEPELAAPGGTLVMDDGFGDLVAEARQAPAPDPFAEDELGGAEKTVEMSGDWASSAPAFEPFSIAPGLEIVAPIGKGGMGSVYRARRATGELVAVKVLTQQGIELPEVVQRFQREIKLSSGLAHPHIVRVYEAGLASGGDHHGRPFFVMDFVQGRDLSAWAQERPRSHREVVEILLPVCAAMNYVHGKGVVHRDLKPGNILVAAGSDQPLVCDFGLAKVAVMANELTLSGGILGTPNYMPPEQAMGKRTQIGPPTDVYALGAVLHFLLTGRPPFTGPTAFAVIDKVMRSPLPSPRELDPSIPPALEQVVIKALSKVPVQRFHTCQQLGEALQAAVA